jgi:hypothetical protein
MPVVLARDADETLVYAEDQSQRPEQLAPS